VRAASIIQPLDEFDSSPIVAPRRFARRTLVLAGVGAVVVVLVIVFLVVGTGGKHDKTPSKSPSATAHHSGATPGSSGGGAGGSGDDSSNPGMHLDGTNPRGGAGQTPDEPAGSAADPMPPETGSADSTGTASAGSGSSIDPTKAQHPTGTAAKPATLGGKPVVLEYDDSKANAAKPNAPVTQEDAAAVARARAAYAAGNQRLFAGDAEGAIRNYKQALATYPGYVAGYRGMGLAYAQQGDNAKALQALRTYVGLVPAAKDAPLIRKRISGLQSH
jgi:hypothetical protein